MAHTAGSHLHRFRRSSSVALRVALVVALLSTVSTVVRATPSPAQSQNEVLTSVLYDGTPSFDAGEPTAESGTAPEAHEPGFDGGANNLVVRTHDQFALRVDWNINEDTATSVNLAVVLPASAEWNPDATGMFAGCDPATSTIPDPQTLLCELGDQTEGSNGVIRPVALLNEAFDNTTFDVTATLTTDADPSGVTDGLDQELTVSEAPIVDYIKADPTKSAEISNGAEDGYVLLYPLTFVDFSQGEPIKGVGPINDAIDVALFDHMWNLTPSVRLATAAEMTTAGFAGTSCGDYAQTGPFVASTGNWSCGAQMTGAGGYPVIPLTVSGFTSRPAPATLADGTPNLPTPQIASGQIAVWLTKAEVDAAIADPNNPDPAIPSTVSAEFDNAITELDATATITSADDVIEAPGNGTSGPALRGTPTNNNVPVAFGEVTAGGSGSVSLWSDVEFEPGPLQLHATKAYSDDFRYGYDIRSTAVGGPGQLPGANPYWHGRSDGSTDFIGQVARGQTVSIHSTVMASTVPNAPYDAKLHGCVAFDDSHYEIVPFADILVSEIDDVGSNAPTVSQQIIPSNTGSLAHFTAGEMVWIDPESGQGRGPSLGESPYTYTVEFSNGAVPRSTASANAGAFALTNDALTCDNADGGTTGWVDAVTGDLSVFDLNNDNRFEGITRARYSITENFLWEPADSVSLRRGMRVFFQARVKDDLNVNTDNQELFVGHSYSYGDRDPLTGTPDTVSVAGTGVTGAAAQCLPPNSAYNSYSANDSQTTTGWCNNRFLDDGTSAFDDTDPVEFDTGAYYINSTWGRYAFADVVRIVGARLAVSKSNLGGTNDIKDNGQTVQFSLRPRVTGATVEALTNVRITDTLPSYYEFVQFIQTPTSPGSSCDESGGTITCQFSEPNPAVDTGALPPGLAGGWSDEVIIEVMVTGAIANPDSATVLANTVSAASSAVGPWDATNGVFTDTLVNGAQNVSSTAFAYMPLPADEGAIIKAVDALEGACVLHPDDDPAPAGWADRCSMIDFEGDMSFLLSLTNEGNTAFTNIEIVDVFPHNGDEVEPISATNTTDPQGSASTVGDGRTPDSDYVGTFDFVSMTPISTPTGSTTVTLVSGDDPATISRDPIATKATNTWCDAAGAVVHGTGSCPATNADVTATFTTIDGDLNPDQTLDLRLTLDSDGHECDDIYTNTFGARVDQILLPIRSNDVSIMVNCEFDLALEKTIDPAFSPGVDWITEGTTTVDFLIEVTNQGDPVEDFDVTDYVDTTTFTFTAANNPDGTTIGTALPYTWDITDPAAPVAVIDGALANGETVTVPVTLIIENAAGTLENWAEISRFDSDGDPTNGDSDPDNANNPSTGPLVDEDSTPDADQADDAQPTNAGAPGDGAIDGSGDGTDPVTGDEDDHDVAGFPIYDLELVKTLGTPALDTSVNPATATYALTITNQGTENVFSVYATDYGAAGLIYNPTATASAWATAGLTGVTDANPTFTIAGPVAPGDSVTIPVVYDINDFAQAPFVNSAEISGFDNDDEPSNALSRFAVDVDSNPDAVDDDDVIDHNVVNNDPDSDGNVNEATPGDEDDHDIEAFAPYDLALTKTLGSVDTPLVPDGSITMMLTVENQMSPVATIDITDYIDATMWQPFNPALNASAPVDASSTAAAGFGFSWDATDPLNPVATVVADTDGDLLLVGETVVVPITLQPVADFVSVAPLTNTAEISNFDNDTDPTNGDASDGSLIDVDSTPDATNGNGPGEDPDADMIDDATDGDSTAGGDEDDHDGISFPIYDLELVKTEATPTFDFGISPPTAAFELIITNQGADPVWSVDVTDYGAAGLTYDPAATAASWTAAGLTGVADASPTFTIGGPIAAGETVTIPVVYQMTDFTQAPFTNTAEISAFDSDDDPTNSASPFAFDVDSTPDAIDDDDVTDHDTTNHDPDADGNLNEATPGDEDDHGLETVAPYDLALVKTFDSMVTPLIPDGSVTMLIEITNQAAPVATFTISDYINPTMWDPFNASLNADGAVHLASTATGFSVAWDATDPLNPVATVTADTSGDMIDFGETIVIPITLEPLPNFQGAEPLSNHAEISNFDSDEDATNGDAVDGTLIDLDSTPDATNGNGPGEDLAANMIDDAIDGDSTTGGDEDDHDVVFVPVYDLELIKTAHDPTFDFSQTPATVTYDLTVTNQGYVPVYWVDVTDYGAEGLTYDSVATLAGWSAAGLSGLVEAAPVFTIRGPLAPGESVIIPVVYQITDFLKAPFTNSAEISKFDSDDDPVNAADPNAIDVDSTPDGVDDDDVIDHNEVNYDPNGNGDVNEATPGDEDDHDVETVNPFDLALAKTLVSADSPLLPDGAVTMLITVTNQLAPVASVDISDYIDASMWRPFDVALNANGAVDATSTATGFSYTWDATDPLHPVASVTADTSGVTIGFGETVAVPIVLQPAVGFDTSLPLTNTAEISNFDNDEDATNGDAADGTLVDTDSVPDAINGNGPGEDLAANMIDDAIDGDSTTGGDEDDHDSVFIPVMDLALRKTVDPATAFPIFEGAAITFTIEIINQGNVVVTNPTLIDYIDPAMWRPFDTAINPAGTNYTWATNANGQDGDLSINASLTPGDTISIPVTLIVNAGADLESLSNSAEITSGTATDSNGEEITNPDGSPVTDIDSTPDATNDDPVTDDVTDGTDGDEDDHDIALVTAPTYNLGNQVWSDTNNDGILDPEETPIEGVTVELFSDLDGDGAPDDTNGDGIIDSQDALQTTITGPDGAYLFTGLQPGDYIVGIPPAMWNQDGPLYRTRPSDPVSSDPNDDVDGDNNGAAGTGGYTWSGPVTLDDSEPTGEAGLNNDPNHPDSLSNLTVDFGFHQPVFDLALEKALATGQPAAVTVGDDVTYTITVTNQGDVAATNIEVVDYLPSSMTLNDTDWTTDADGKPVITLAGPLAGGSSTTVDITVTITGAGTLDNHAEISDATPVDSNGDRLTMPNGQPVPDLDSTSDDSNNDMVTDGITNEDGLGGGDEDDHDIATLIATAAPSNPNNPSGPLAFSGSETRNVAMVALMFIALGMTLLAGTRRRRTRLD